MLSEPPSDVFLVLIMRFPLIRTTSLASDKSQPKGNAAVMMLPSVANVRACVVMGQGFYIKTSSGKAARTPNVHRL